LGIEYVFGLKTFILMWIFGFLSMAGCWVALYALWVLLLEFPYPMPLIGLFNFVAGFVGEVVVLYFQIPKSWRKDSGFFKNILWLVCAQLFLIVAFLLYVGLGWGFYIIPRNFQWTLSFVVPIVDEISTRTLVALCFKAAGREDESVSLIAGSLIAISTSLFMAVNLGSIATSETAYVMLALAFVMNLKEIVAVYKLYKGGEETFNEYTEAIQGLVINMALELILPLSYLACFLLAYFGPNAMVLGNIGNSYWHYGAVDNVVDAIFNLFLFLSLDALTILFTMIFFKCVADFNFIKMYGYLQKEYGMMMSISQAYLMIHNFCVIIVACAMDLTFKFNWVFEEGVA
jgi:hypothetical protein